MNFLKLMDKKKKVKFRDENIILLLKLLMQFVLSKILKFNLVSLSKILIRYKVN